MKKEAPSDGGFFCGTAKFSLRNTEESLAVCSVSLYGQCLIFLFSYKIMFTDEHKDGEATPVTPVETPAEPTTPEVPAAE
jgi:hypothetical protein